ncbi:MAG: Gfo/Idh/MocA family protein [Acidimicrobiaceae bacterium]
MAPGNSVNVVVVGAGSIGSRHQRILRQLGHQVSVVSANSPDAEFKFLSDALERQSFEYVVIASQTSQHFHDFSTLIRNKFKGRVLIEKPVFEKPRKLKSNLFSLAAVGYNLRFHPAIIWLRETLPKLGQLSSANFYVGQYLPTWRPDTDYRRSSSAQDISGGGVLRDLSHELDLAQHLFGDWQRLTAIGGKFSDLEITTDDTFSILMSATKCNVVSVHLNYLDQIKQRNITINGNNGTISIDLVGNTAKFNETEFKFSVSADASYTAQHLALIANDSRDICTLYDALKVVDTIEAIETSAKKQKWVRQ